MEPRWCFVWTLLMITMHKGLCLRDGAPEEACEYMKPNNRPGPEGREGHVAWAQNLKPTPPNSRVPPYTIMVSEGVYHKPGSNYRSRIKLHLVAHQEGIHNFYKGVILQARRATCVSNTTTRTTGTAVGHFSIVEPSSIVLKTTECWYRESTVTHKFPAWKINETVEWIAPEHPVGNIVFRATFVREKQIFWTDVYSTVVRDLSQSPVPVCGATSLSITALTYILTSALFTLIYIKQ